MTDERLCTVCNGRQMVFVQGPNATHPCGHCRGTGIEPAAPSTDEGEAKGAAWLNVAAARQSLWNVVISPANGDIVSIMFDNVVRRFEAAIRAPLEERIRALQTTDYRCEEMCEAAQYGGSCRCSHLSNELPAAEERIRELEVHGSALAAVDGERIEYLEAEVEKLREALRWAYDQFPPEMHGAVHPVLDRALATPPSSTEGTEVRWNCTDCENEDVTPLAGHPEYHIWIDGNGNPTTCGPLVRAGTDGG